MSGASVTETWDLSAIFASDAEWDAEHGALSAEIALLKPLQGRLARDGASLLAALDRMSRAKKRLNRLHSAARLEADQDVSLPAAQAKLQRADDVSAEFDAAIAFVAPEIAALGAGALDRLLAAEPGLDRHAFTLCEIIRLGGHTLGDEAEGVLAAARAIQAGPARLYRLLAHGCCDWAEIPLGDGRRVRLDQEGYAAQMHNPDRGDRKAAFDAYWDFWARQTDLAGGIYGAHLRAVGFEAQARKYPSSLAFCLADSDIPESIYHTVIAQARAGLPALHRYLHVRRRLLDVPELQPFDLFAPMAPGMESYSLQQAKELTLRATRPLGPHYQAELAAGLAGSWMDAAIRPGKISGAYQDGANYDLHPFVLLNFTGSFTSVSALAHEWGHAMHSLFANRAQPFETSEYALFLAEIPATLNELLLAEHMIGSARSTPEKIFHLGHALELLRGTFFAQAEHAEFELAAHAAAERGAPLSGEDLSATYLELSRTYLGHAEGVTTVPDAYSLRWAHLPHFYRDYYCYQYATSIAAAALFMRRLQGSAAAERERFFAMMRAGGSANPAEILACAGIDLAAPDPYRAVVEYTNDLTDQLEALIE